MVVETSFVPIFTFLTLPDSEKSHSTRKVDGHTPDTGQTLRLQWGKNSVNYTNVPTNSLLYVATITQLH